MDETSPSGLRFHLPDKKWVLIAGGTAGIVAVLLIALFLSPAPAPVIEEEPPPVPTCTDSDGGSLPAVNGTCVDANGKKIDICLDGDVLLEHRCDEDCEVLEVRCSTIGLRCRGGACVPLEGNQTIVEEPPTRPLPDLIINSINQFVTNKSYLNITGNGTNQTNETAFNITLFASAAIKNIGSFPADSTSVNLSLTGPITGEHFGRTEVLLENDIDVISTAFDLENYTGTFTLYASVDWADKINESNENNNDASSTFTVT